MSFYLKPEYAGNAYRASERTPENAYPRKSLQERGLRFYSPNLSRWLSRDPIGEKGGLGLYMFCANDSVAKHDARGLNTEPQDWSLDTGINWQDQMPGGTKVLPQPGKGPLPAPEMPIVSATVNFVAPGEGSQSGCTGGTKDTTRHYKCSTEKCTYATSVGVQSLLVCMGLRRFETWQVCTAEGPWFKTYFNTRFRWRDREKTGECVLVDKGQEDLCAGRTGPPKTNE